MLVAAGTVVRFTNNFQRSLTQTTTQAAARSVIDAVAQSIQYGAGGIDPINQDAGAGNTQSYCVGTKRYTYKLGAQLMSTGNPVFIEEDTGIPSCNGQNGSLGSGNRKNELLAPGMRLAYFNISNPDETGVRSIVIRVAYGDTDLLCSANASPNDCNDPQDKAASNMNNASYLQGLMCKSQKGSQFCAVSELRTSARPRQ